MEGGGYNKDTEAWASLGQVLAKDYISVVLVDLYTDKAHVLRSTLDSEIIGRTMPWEDLKKRYADRRVYGEDREKVLSITEVSLSEYLNGSNRIFPMEVRCCWDKNVYNWIEISAKVVSEKARKLLLTARDINESRMMKGIIDIFVEQNLDYLALLNTKNNSYIMYSSTIDAGPEYLQNAVDYTAEMIRYNRKYVVPEEVKDVIANMEVPNILKQLASDDSYCFTCRLILGKNDLRIMHIKFVYFDKPAGLVLLTRTDVTQIYKEEQEKQGRLAAALRDAQQDALTGIYNRKATEGLTINLLENQYRKSVAILFIDVDNFKIVNDTLGHQKGDELLRYLALYLKNLGGRTGIAGRVGGDEFLLVLPDITGLKEVERYAGKICRLFKTKLDETIQELPISCSVGISIYPQDGTDYHALVSKSDQALYKSKRFGKNKYSFYSGESILQN